MENSRKSVVVALSQDEARIWLVDFEKGSLPTRVFAPSEKNAHHHVRGSQSHHGHSSDPAEKGFFDVIISHVASADEILLIGHGVGKANAVFRFAQFAERYNSEVAKKILGALDSNLPAMTENEILSLAREWFEKYRRTH